MFQVGKYNYFKMDGWVRIRVRKETGSQHRRTSGTKVMTSEKQMTARTYVRTYVSACATAVSCAEAQMSGTKTFVKPHNKYMVHSQVHINRSVSLQIRHWKTHPTPRCTLLALRRQGCPMRRSGPAPHSAAAAWHPGGEGRKRGRC